ncbi:MAG: SDR family oxidoreductase [Betaproteobacteria bacterium]|nr:SDR family oxidoreductase [Betaproteobacteria bacterium]
MKELNGQVAIVTGAGHERGIGYATAVALARRGARIVITDRADTEARKEQLALVETRLKDYGTPVLRIAADITDATQRNAIVDQALEAFGRIDILFNNAGTDIGCGPYLEIQDQAWAATVQINLIAIAELCRLVLPVMQRQQSGVIINNASMAGLKAIAHMAAYTSSKFGVVGLTKAIAAEFGADRIRCNAVCPGIIDTPMGRGGLKQLCPEGMSVEGFTELVEDGFALKRLGQPHEVAEAVAFLAGPYASYITGVALPVDGGAVNAGI